jgi:hypothetical protein
MASVDAADHGADDCGTTVLKPTAGDDHSDPRAARYRARAETPDCVYADLRNIIIPGAGCFPMRFLGCLALCLSLLVLTATEACAEKRVALVIGNGAYKSVPPLTNPTNDAADVAASLKRSGFDLVLGTDLDQAGMQDAAIRFAREARDADVALFYYSGHALQYAGVNYLVPVDAVLRDEVDLRRMARADEILADLQQARNLRILVLDACRDNPFAEQLKRTIGQGRGINVGRGLAKMESPEGTIISYATQAGRTADDGDGRNSPYTTAFLKHIQDKDNIATVFQTISASVYEETKGAQVPELSLSFFGEFYLNGKPDKPASSTTAALPGDPCAEAAEHWHSAEAAGTIDAFRDHLLRFPTCAFGSLAKAKIEEMSKADAAAKRTNPFDGTWIVKETCEKNARFPAATVQYTLLVKDGTLHARYGDGKPGQVTFDGKVEADGSAKVAVDGLTDPSKDPLHRPPGTPFHYGLALQLKESSGAGARTQSPRPCRLELSKLSATPSPSSNADESSNDNGKRNDSTAVAEPDRRDSGTRQARPAGSGLSCSVMRGRCAVVCVANSGRQDCASTVCVRLEQECMSTGCWHGRGFSGCGLARR